MHEAITTLSGQANLKLRALLQTRRNFTTREIINLFKSRVLGYIEYRTSAIYHASNLSQIDAILGRLLRTMGITEEESLLEFNLAPLQTRRDIAMLGLIHRSVIGEGPHQFQKHFIREGLNARPHGRVAHRQHNKQLVSHRTGKHLDLLSHSLLGLIDIYNLLPQYIIHAKTVSEFQMRLQLLVKDIATTKLQGWQEIYSPRNSLWNNKLKKMHEWCPQMARTSQDTGRQMYEHATRSLFSF